MERRGGVEQEAIARGESIEGKRARRVERGNSNMESPETPARGTQLGESSE